MNEAERLDPLESFGFIKLRMEELSLGEQLRFTCNASALVTPHGAGMAHCAFLPAGTLVLKHFAPIYVNPRLRPSRTKARPPTTVTVTLSPGASAVNYLKESDARP